MARAKKKLVPKFKSNDEERAFWARHDSKEYVDCRLAEQHTFTNLKKERQKVG